MCTDPVLITQARELFNSCIVYKQPSSWSWTSTATE